MIEGIMLTIGIVLVIIAKVLYCLFGLMVGKKSTDNIFGWPALLTDGLGTILIIMSLLSYFKT